MNGKLKKEGPSFSSRQEENIVEVFKLLSDGTRVRLIMNLVREGEMHVNALCECVDFAQPAVSHHLKLLLDANMIDVRKAGRHNYYSVNLSRFHSVIEQLFETFKGDGDDKLCFHKYVLTENT